MVCPGGAVVSGPRHTPRSMLDAILDHVIDGGEVNLVVLDDHPQQCENPMYAPATSYGKGCRCHRCRTGHNAQVLASTQRNRELINARRRAFKVVQGERRW